MHHIHVVYQYWFYKIQFNICFRYKTNHIDPFNTFYSQILVINTDLMINCHIKISI